MKKVFDFLMVLCIAVSFVGCSSSDEDNSSTSPDDKPDNCITMKTKASKVEIYMIFPKTGYVTIDWGDGNISDHKGSSEFDYLGRPSYTETVEHTYSATESKEHVIKINGTLVKLSCRGNMLTYLDVRNCTELNTLWCHDNLLVSLDVSRCTSLEYLICSDNFLTSLDVSQNKLMEILRLEDNRLTSLDVQNNEKLETLYVDDNQLTVLNVQKNEKLESLQISGNKISSLDISKNVLLVDLWCDGNPLNDAAMNKIYTDLPQGRKYTSSNGNEVTSSLFVTSLTVGNSAIATNKGWEVRERK